MLNTCIFLGVQKYSLQWNWHDAWDSKRKLPRCLVFLESSCPLALMTSHSLLLFPRYILVSLLVNCRFHYLCLSPCLCCPWLWKFVVACFVQVQARTWTNMTERHCQWHIQVPMNTLSQELLRPQSMWSRECPAMCWNGRRLYRGEGAQRQGNKSLAQVRGKDVLTGEDRGRCQPAQLFSERQGSILDIIRL